MKSEDIKLGGDTLTVREDGAVTHKNGKRRRSVYGSQTPEGYKYIQIHKVNTFVHRLVARAFLGLEEDDPRVVHHKNGDRAYNWAHNLEVLQETEHNSLPRPRIHSLSLTPTTK